METWHLDDIPIENDDADVRELGGRWLTVDRLLASQHTPPLVKAILSHDDAELTKHLDAATRAAAVGPSEDPLTPLHYAVLSGNLTAVDALLEAGVDPHERSGREAYPVVLEAFAYASLPVLDRILEAKPDLTLRGPPPRAFTAPVWSLFRKSDDEVVAVLERLSKLGIDCRQNHRHGTLLHYAARDGRLRLAAWCVEQGIAVDARTTPTGRTPLVEAAGRHHPDVVDFLVRAGADVHATDGHHRSSVLHAVAIGQSPNAASVIDRLLAHGLDIDVRDDRGMTPLHVACQFVSIDAATALTARGASRDARDASGKGPLDHLETHVSTREDPNVIRRLLTA